MSELKADIIIDTPSNKLSHISVSELLSIIDLPVTDSKFLSDSVKSLDFDPNLKDTVEGERERLIPCLLEKL